MKLVRRTIAIVCLLIGIAPLIALFIDEPGGGEGFILAAILFVWWAVFTSIGQELWSIDKPEGRGGEG